MKELIESGILGLDDILGGGRIKGESILVIGPPGSGKTLFALSLLYKALVKPTAFEEIGLYLTTDEYSKHLTESTSDMFMERYQNLVSMQRLLILDLPPYNTPSNSEGLSENLTDSKLPEEIVMDIDDYTGPKSSEDMVMDIDDYIKNENLPSPPKHIVIDGLTSLQSVLENRSEERRLTHLIKAHISNCEDIKFDLVLITSEAPARLNDDSYYEQIFSSFEAYLFDTIIYLDIAKTPADRRLRTIEILKSRGRRSRSGRHTFSIFNKDGVRRLIQSETAQKEIIGYDVPIAIYPREPRNEHSQHIESSTAKDEYVKTGIDGLDELFDQEQKRGLLKYTTSLVIGGPGSGSSLLSLRYLMEGLKQENPEPVLFIGFGRDIVNFLRLGSIHPWIKYAKKDRKNFHYLYYRPINVDQNRLFYEIRKEVEEHKINRVAIDSISSLPLIHLDNDLSNDFFVSFIGLLKEIGCTTMFSYISNSPPEPMATPGKSIPSLAVDNILIQHNEWIKGKSKMQKNIFILKSRGADAIFEKRELYIGPDDLAIRPL